MDECIPFFIVISLFMLYWLIYYQNMKDMKKLAKIIRITSKIAFKKLHQKWFLTCGAIQKNVQVTNLFYYHISGSAKKRSLKEVVTRLSCIVVVPIILLKWYIAEVRYNTTIEWRNSDIAIQINLQVKWIHFATIVSLRKNKFYLISTFIDHQKKSPLGFNPRLA